MKQYPNAAGAVGAVSRLLNDEQGGETVEWPLMVGLVVLGFVVLWLTAGIEPSVGAVADAISRELGFVGG
ncbi:MAG: hypothetical protein U9Q81_02500 [Pseudomonadota bacterium]|nr:hypothetical protein [Pseudomonadota bacterium]